MQYDKSCHSRKSTVGEEGLQKSNICLEFVWHADLYMHTDGISVEWADGRLGY